MAALKEELCYEELTLRSINYFDFATIFSFLHATVKLATKDARLAKKMSDGE